MDDDNKLCNVEDFNFTKEEQAKIKPEDINSTLTFLEFCKHHRHQQILKEFECIAEFPIDGVYVFPSLKSLQIWYGVVFVHTGLFAEGIFHFKVILNDDYPYSMPSIRFDSKVFHPQVSPKGSLNIKYSVVPNEKKGQIWNALKYTRDCFHNINLDASNNEKVLQIMKRNAEEFKALTRGCVLESLYDMEERTMNTSNSDLEVENPFNARLLSSQLCTTMKREFATQSESNFPENEEGLISWTKNTMGKMWNNLSNLSSGSPTSSAKSSPDHSPNKTLNGHSYL